MTNQSDAEFYATLSELAYRRNNLDYSVKLDWLALNPDSPFSVNVADLNSQLFELGLIRLLPSDDQDGEVIHLWNETGFSAFVVQRGDQFIISIRGTDVGADIDIANLFSAITGLFNGPGPGARNSQDFQAWLVENAPAPGDDQFQNFDAGDWYTNVQLGAGTYGETQYDYVAALVNFVITNLANGDTSKVIVTGQSLGGGLAGLAAIKFGG